MTSRRIKRNADGIYCCTRCGDPSPDQARPHLGKCRCFPPPARKRFALGDAVERTLSAVGITPERVSRVTGKPCGCKARKRRLNEWGYRQQERLERAIARVAGSAS